MHDCLACAWIVLAFANPETKSLGHDRYHLLHDTSITFCEQSWSQRRRPKLLAETLAMGTLCPCRIAP
jgi:hypothetical protein